MGFLLPSFKHSIECQSSSYNVAELLKGKLADNTNTFSGSVNLTNKNFIINDDSKRGTNNSKFYRPVARGSISDTETGCKITVDFQLQGICLLYVIGVYALFLIGIVLSIVSYVIEKTDTPYGFIVLLFLVMLLSQAILRTGFGSSAKRTADWLEEITKKEE